jgi:hypothetical protein
MEPRFRLPTDDPWFATTWEGARLTHLIEAANWSMARKLAWLEDASELAARLHAQQPSPPTEPAEGERDRRR